jgi:hypothetical protein
MDDARTELEALQKFSRHEFIIDLIDSEIVASSTGQVRVVYVRRNHSHQSIFAFKQEKYYAGGKSIGYTSQEVICSWNVI